MEKERICISLGAILLAKSSPGRPLTEVNAVAADGFLDHCRWIP